MDPHAEALILAIVDRDKNKITALLKENGYAQIEIPEDKNAVFCGIMNLHDMALCDALTAQAGTLTPEMILMDPSAGGKTFLIQFLEQHYEKFDLTDSKTAVWLFRQAFDLGDTALAADIFTKAGGLTPDDAVALIVDTAKTKEAPKSLAALRELGIDLTCENSTGLTPLEILKEQATHPVKTKEDAALYGNAYYGQLQLEIMLGLREPDPPSLVDKLKHVFRRRVIS